MSDRVTTTTSTETLTDMIEVLDAVPEAIWQVTFARGEGEVEDTFVFTRDEEGLFYLEGVG